MLAAHIIEIALIIILFFLNGYNNGKTVKAYNTLKNKLKMFEKKYTSKCEETYIPIVKTSNNAKLPHRGSDEAAGYDLHALLNENRISIPPHTTVKINTGLTMALPKGYAGLIYARSGLAVKQGLAPANKVGVIDSDYRGEIIVALHNHTDEEQFINDGDRIAQLVVAPYKKCNFIEVSELDGTKRGDGGFGSSGK